MDVQHCNTILPRDGNWSYTTGSKLYKRKMPQSRQVVPKLFTIVHACIPAPILSPVSTTIFYSILVEIITSAFKVLYKERNNHRAYFKAVVRKGRKATLSVFPFCIIVLHVTLWKTNISHVFKISDNMQSPTPGRSRQRNRSFTIIALAYSTISDQLTLLLGKMR